MHGLTGDPVGQKSNTVGASGKGSCFELQVCGHLTRFLQLYQVKFIPLAEVKAVGTLVGAQDALTEGIWDANVECSMMLEGMKN